MNDLLKQCTSVTGAGFAGACCLGVTGALSIVTALGAAFLLDDAFLIPLYLGFLGLSLRLLHGSARSHSDLTPFWTGLGAALLAFVGLWIHAGLVFAGLAALIASSVWDFVRGRRLRTPPG